ncbi:glutathione S-transferase P-like [Rhinoraja longicauda]
MAESGDCGGDSVASTSTKQKELQSLRTPDDIMAESGDCGGDSVASTSTKQKGGKLTQAGKFLKRIWPGTSSKKDGQNTGITTEKESRMESRTSMECEPAEEEREECQPRGRGIGDMVHSPGTDPSGEIHHNREISSKESSSLVQGAETWNDEIVTGENWLGGSLKDSCVFGQLPKFQDGDFVLFQSNAILRYLGRKYGLHGNNDKESAMIDMFNDGVEDLRLKYIALIYKDYEAGKDKFVKSLPEELKWFEKILENNNKGQRFFHGVQISYVDYNFVDLLGNLDILAPGCLKEMPLIEAYMERVKARPKLQAYLQSDAHRKLPINGNGKQ